MKTTKQLPFEYTYYGQLNLLSNKKHGCVANLLAFPLMALAGLFFLLVPFRLIRPDLFDPDLAMTCGLVDIILLVGVTAAIYILHETVHGIGFWWMTGDRPEFGLSWLYAYAAAPGWYIPRNPMIVIILAPLVILTSLSLALLPLLPVQALPYLLFFVTMNAAGSIGDLIITGWLLKQPHHTLAGDRGLILTSYHPEPEKRRQLQEKWAEALRPLSPNTAQAQAQLDQLIAHHSEAGRHYHNLNHVLHVLDTIEARQHLAQDSTAVQLAAWFHDVIYQPGAADNEERSAAYAAQALPALNAPEEMVTAIQRLILLTKTHHPPEDDPDAQVLLDADLAILGAEPERYDEYAHAICREYAHLPDKAYRQARRRVLEQFLQRERLYTTEIAAAQYEAQARANLERELNALGRKNPI